MFLRNMNQRKIQKLLNSLNYEKIICIICRGINDLIVLM